MCEPRSDIPPNWNDIRTKFGYTMLATSHEERGKMGEAKEVIEQAKNREC